MKKNLIAIAVGAMAVLPGISSAADTKVYGKFNISLDNLKDEINLSGKGGPTSEASWRFLDNENSSRLGFKGSEDVGLGDLQVIYQLEYGINPDGDEKDDASLGNAIFTQRNIYLGLKGGFGTVKFGKYDTLIKEAGTKVDQFNDEGSIGDIKYLMAGEERENNLVTYISPKIADVVTLSVAVQPGESRVAADNVADVEDGLTDSFFVGADFDLGAVFASLTYGNNSYKNLKVDTGTVGSDVLRVVVGTKLPMGLELGALYQQAEGIDQTGAVTTGPTPVPAAAATGGDRKDTSYLVSAAYSFDAWKLKAQYGSTDADQKDVSRDAMAVGVDYKLSKSLVSQLYYVKYTQDAATGDLDSNAYGLGLVYSF